MKTDVAKAGGVGASAPARGGRRGARTGRAARLAALYAVTLLGAVIFTVPFLWMLSTALKPDILTRQFPPVWIPPHPRWENFALAWRSVDFTRMAWNTMEISVLSTLGSTLSAAMVAFGFARIRFAGRDTVFMLLLSTMMLPGVVTMVPGYILFRELGWIDTYLPLIVPSFFGGGAFAIFLLRQFFLTIPTELDEAARMDGATFPQIFWRVIMPLSKPAVTTIALFAFMGGYKDFMGPLIFLNTESKHTLELGLQSFSTLYGTHYNLMMAAAIIVSLPVIVIFFSCQKYFIEGITLTGLKG
jgi:ABC-type glycerol-3-phosphate transport system permease component